MAKLSTEHINHRSAFIYTGTGVVIAGLFVVFLLGSPRPEPNLKGAVFGLLAGLCGTIGSLLFFTAMSKGKASVVVVLTALYPLVTVILSFLFLKEQITIKQALGMVFAFIAMVLFST